MKNRQGFTLIETMIVVSLVCILMSMVHYGWIFLDRTMVRAQVEHLHSVCRFLQMHAMMSNTQQYLLFDRDAQTYSFLQEKHQLGRGLQFGIVPGVYGPPGNPVSAVSKPITFLNNTITFYPTGIIQAGAVYVCDMQKRFQYALSNAVGHISMPRIYRYDGQWVLL